MAQCKPKTKTQPFTLQTAAATSPGYTRSTIPLRVQTEIVRLELQVMLREVVARAAAELVRVLEPVVTRLRLALDGGVAPGNLERRPRQQIAELRHPTRPVARRRRRGQRLARRVEDRIAGRVGEATRIALAGTVVDAAERGEPADLEREIRLGEVEVRRSADVERRVPHGAAVLARVRDADERPADAEARPGALEVALRVVVEEPERQDLDASDVHQARIRRRVAVPALPGEDARVVPEEARAEEIVRPELHADVAIQAELRRHAGVIDELPRHVARHAHAVERHLVLPGAHREVTQMIELGVGLEERARVDDLIAQIHIRGRNRELELVLVVLAESVPGELEARAPDLQRMIHPARRGVLVEQRVEELEAEAQPDRELLVLALDAQTVTG